MKDLSLRIFVVTAILFVAIVFVLSQNGPLDLFLNWELWSVITWLLILAVVLAGLGIIAGLVELIRSVTPSLKTVLGVVGNSSILILIVSPSLI